MHEINIQKVVKIGVSEGWDGIQKLSRSGEREWDCCWHKQVVNVVGRC